MIENDSLALDVVIVISLVELLTVPPTVDTTDPLVVHMSLSAAAPKPGGLSKTSPSLL